VEELREILAREHRRCRAATRRIDRSLIRLRGHLTLPDGEGVIIVTPSGVAIAPKPGLPVAAKGVA